MMKMAGLNIKEIFWMMNITGKEHFIIQMEIIIKVIL